jgi:hypothetical protein
MPVRALKLSAPVALRTRVEPPAADLLTQIREAERALRALHQQRDAQLLLTIAAVSADRVFTGVELWRHQAASRDLREAFRQSELGSCRRLGKRLERLQGQDLFGLQLERVGADRDGVVWCVRVRPTLT